MSAADVTVISLVTDQSREAVNQVILPAIDHALSELGVEFERLPVTRDYIDWIVEETDTLTVAVDAIDGASVVMVAGRGTDAEICAGRLANIAADLYRTLDAHTVYLNGSGQQLSPAEFLAAGQTLSTWTEAVTPVVPRKVRLSRSLRAAQRSQAAQFDNVMLRDIRAKMNSVTEDDVRQLELDERRARSAPLRLSAWALSFATALVALPLAFPLIIHNALRGEDLRAGAMALGVAGLYAGLAQSGMAPVLADLL